MHVFVLLRLVDDVQLHLGDWCVSVCLSRERGGRAERSTMFTNRRISPHVQTQYCMRNISRDPYKDNCTLRCHAQ
eukprot:50609-Eustigmatos_ZCMA.PRE.1